MHTRRRSKTTLAPVPGERLTVTGQANSMLQNVLVAVDSSDLAWSVIEALSYLQLAPNCLVVLAHIVPPPELEDFVAADVPHQEQMPEPIEAETWLETLSERIEHATAQEIVTGDAAEEIVRLAGIHRADLIVIGSRGLRGVDRVIRGSVSSEVVTDAPCPVLVVKP